MYFYLLWSLAAAAHVQTSVPSADTWAWVREVHDDVWERVAIVSQPSGLRPAVDDDDWQILVTAIDGYDSYSWQFLLRKPWRAELELSYVHLAGSLAGRLADLREREHNLTVDAAVDLLAPRRLHLNSRSCPKLKDLGTDLETLEIRVLPERSLTLHSPAYEVHIVPTYRASIQLTVRENENGLALWSASVIEASLACGGNPDNTR